MKFVWVCIVLVGVFLQQGESFSAGWPSGKRNEKPMVCFRTDKLYEDILVVDIKFVYKSKLTTAKWPSRRLCETQQ